MKKASNTVIINSGKIEITEPQRPVPFMFLMILMISGVQGFFSTLGYIETGETGHLFIASFSLSLFALAILKEIFFITYQKEIAIDDISAVKIQPILFGKGSVFLELKIGKMTRQVLLTKAEANKIYKELNP